MKLHSRLFWLFVLVVHVAAAGVWWGFMAGGFPASHWRFVANRVMPAVVILVGLVGLWAGHKGKTAIVHAVLAGFGMAWIAAGLTGIFVFPISARFVAPITVAIGLLIAVWGWRSIKRPGTMAMILAGAAVGVVIPFTQRGAEAQTRTMDVAVPELPSQGGETAPGMTGLSPGVRVGPRDGSVTCQWGNRFMTIDPMLTFVSRSPDRCWIAFAPKAMREPPRRKLSAWERADSSIRMQFEDGISTSALSVRANGDVEAEIDAISEIAQPIYSHLNTFCEISLAGHTDLAVEFSPCPGKRIAVVPFDYPVGRPARLAYLDAAGVFHVVEASSGEKGPYRELASGPLGREEALTITLLDNGKAIASLRFEDWARQASTQLSPTAGWGVTENAIEYSLQGEGMRSGASLFVTLASTSAGRGFDSVGHAAGTYRNRMTIRLLAD